MLQLKLLNDVLVNIASMDSGDFITRTNKYDTEISKVVPAVYQKMLDVWDSGEATSIGTTGTTTMADGSTIVIEYGSFVESCSVTIEGQTYTDDYLWTNTYKISVYDDELVLHNTIFCKPSVYTNFDITDIYVVASDSYQGYVNHLAFIFRDIAGQYIMTAQANALGLTVINNNIIGFVEVESVTLLTDGEPFVFSNFYYKEDLSYDVEHDVITDKYGTVLRKDGVDINSTSDMQEKFDRYKDYTLPENAKKMGTEVLEYLGWDGDLKTMPTAGSIELVDGSHIDISFVYDFATSYSRLYRLNFKIYDSDDNLIQDVTSPSNGSNLSVETTDNGDPGSGPYHMHINSIYLQLNNSYDLSDGIAVFLLGFHHGSTADDDFIFGCRTVLIAPLDSTILNEDNTEITYSRIDDQGYEEEPTGADGGDGEYNQTSDNPDAPSRPSMTSSGTGFIRIFNPSQAEMIKMSKAFSDPSSSFMTWIKKYFTTNPLESIISLHTIPAKPTQASVQTLTFGGNTVSYVEGEETEIVSMHRVTEQFIDLDFGSVTIKEKWGSALDYLPHTKAELYLPFVGYVSLDTDLIMNSTISLEGMLDAVTGTIFYWLNNGDAIIGQWSGSAIMTHPLNYASHNSAISSIISLGTSLGQTALGLATMGATGGISGASAISGGIGVLTGSMNTAQAISKPDLSSGGSLSTVSGFMGSRTPYINIKRPKQAYPSDYKKYVGYPAVFKKTVGSCAGFTAFENVILQNISATQEEKDEMLRLLQEGVYI